MYILLHIYLRFLLSDPRNYELSFSRGVDRESARPRFFCVDCTVTGTSFLEVLIKMANERRA